MAILKEMDAGMEASDVKRLHELEEDWWCALQLRDGVGSRLGVNK